MSAFDWSGYLLLARELSRRSDEPSRRSAISRAYYFVFNMAANRPAVDQYRFPDDKKDHAEVWALYKRNANQDCQKLALIGGRMKYRRVTADYRPLYPRLEEELARTLEDAEACATIFGCLGSEYPQPVPKKYSAK
jgi:hypothetical protein